MAIWLGATTAPRADQLDAAPPLAPAVTDPNQPNGSGFATIGAPDILNIGNGLGAGFAPIIKSKNSTIEDNRVVLNADKVTYDDDLNIVTARGHVQLMQGNQVLTANLVSYNQNTDQVSASGSVILRDQQGNIFFGDYLELRDEMSAGFIDQVKGILLGDVRLVGNTATRRDDNIMDISRAVYSPCALCATNPAEPPIWQLKARQAEHNADEQQIDYYDATFEFEGVPVLYTPYFSSADPTVKQRSGFLAPEGGESSTLGAIGRSYYYYGISPQEDATLETTYATKQGPLLGGEYRNRTEYGKFVFSGSIAEGADQYGPSANQSTPDKTERGHIFGLGVYDLDDNWRSGFNIARTTDDTFLREYGYSDQDVLDNRLYIEGFFDRDYAVTNIYDAQDLRPGIVGTQPIAAPYSNYQAFGDQGETLGGRWEFNTGFLGLLRPGAENIGNLALTTQGITPDPTAPIAKSGQQNVARYSVDGGWQRTLITNGISNEVDGHIFLDAYGTNNQPNLPDNPVDTNTGGNFDGRYLPQIHDISSYPLIAQQEDGHILVQPTGSFTFAPTSLARNNKIPNEDSQDLEFDSTNLFSANRFPGIDRIESGAHVAYGLQSGYYLDSGGYATSLIGQSRRLSGPDIFPTGSGLNSPESDYVGGLNLSPGKYINISYQTRLADNSFASRLHELNMSFQPDPQSINVYGLNYIFLNKIPSISNDQNRNSLNPFVTQRLSKYWTTTASIAAQLGGESRLQQIASTTTYQDDCLIFQIQASRDLTNSVGGLSGTSIFFRIGLKTLGFFQSPNIAGALSPLVGHTSGTTGSQ